MAVHHSMRFRVKAAMVAAVLACGLGGAVVWTAQSEIDHEVRQIETITTAFREQDLPLRDLIGALRLDIVQVQQFLQDVSATRAQDGLGDGFARAEEQAQAFAKDLAAATTVARATGDTRLLDTLTATGRAFGPFYEVGKRMAQAYVDGGPSAGNAMMPEFDERTEAMTECNPQDQMANTGWPGICRIAVGTDLKT